MISFKNKKGSALFIVLGCVALMTLLVVAFLGSSIAERTTANSFAKEINSKLLAENAINLVMSQIRIGTKSVNPTGTTGIAWASQPGMIRTYTNTGTADHYYKLYSWDNMIGTGAYSGADAPDANWATETDLFTDINEAVNSCNPIISALDQKGNNISLTSTTVASHMAVKTYISNSGTIDIEGFYIDPALASTWLPANNVVAMPVKWIYILRDGTQVVPTPAGATGVNVTGATVANPIVGRIAFWTDDECSKVNINTAAEGTPWDVPITWSREDFGAWNGTGNTTTITTPCGMDTAIPAAPEYQRTPGHPAMTCLSTVFGSILPIPVPPFSETGAGSYEALLAPYYTLTPRYAPGGTKGGTRPSYADAGAFAGSTSTTTTYSTANWVVPTYRLYASVDELVFDPYRYDVATTTNAVLYSTAGTSPTGRAAIPGMKQAFLNEAQFFLTANSKAPEETLFDTPRISLWPLQTDTSHARNTLDNLLAFCATINKFPYYFQRGGYFTSSVSGSFNPTSGGAAAGFANGTSQDMAYDMGGSTSSSGAMTLGDPTTLTATSTSYLDTDIRRNLNLMAYLRRLTGADNSGKTIPGFGGNFLNKYPGAAGISDIDQILVDMFDYIRSGVNTISLAYTPSYQYCPSGSVGNGTSLPIRVSIGGKTISGLGRTPAIAEVALVFMPAIPPGFTHSFKDTTTFGTSGSTTPAYSPTSGSDGLPDEVLSSDGTYPTASVSGTLYPVGSPQTIGMQAFLVVRPVGIMPSLVQQNSNLRIGISGLDSWSIDYSGGTNPIGTGTPNLGFPSGGNAVDLLCANLTSGSALGFGWIPTIGPVFNMTGTTVRSAGTSTGDWNGTWGITATATLTTTGNAMIYPFVGSILQLPTAANPSRFGGLSGTVDVLGSSAPPPSTFSFSGGPITITIYSGFPSKTANAPVIQTIKMNFPAISSLPIPGYDRANSGDYGAGADGGANANLIGTPPQYRHPAITDPRQVEYYSQVRWNIDKISDRIGCVTSGGTYTSTGAAVANPGQWNYEALLARGDTIRSMVLNPNSEIGGDTRVVANMSSVPVNDSQNVPIYTYLGANATMAQKTNGAGLSQLYPGSAYGNSSYGQFHTLYFDSGDYFDWQLRVDTMTGSAAWDTAPVNWRSYQGGLGITGGALFSGANYWGGASPLVTPELTAAQMTLGGNKYAGDWTNGYGTNPDGPLVWGPDEGFQGGVSGFDAPYYITFGGSGTTSTDKNESFSPNRQIASPVMFGTLPAGVQAGTGWRNLLFCPNPAAGSNHPGFGVGSGTAGPADYPPYSNMPPDHLLLDDFWMPIVQPYAISEPFATAGKINMNYQIVPFSEIHRSTGVRAVLKSVGLLALSPAASPLQTNSTTNAQYKIASGTFQRDPIIPGSFNHSDNYRYQINLDETVDAADSGFQARFNATQSTSMPGALNAPNSDIFHSASEICNIFLVPQAIPGNTYTSAGSNTPPADYYHTAAWWSNFQLTGINSRESPYNQIYPRLTTKSNTFQVYYRVQALVKNAANNTPAVFDTTNGDSIGGEYRGSAIIERYIDPNDSTLPDFATAFPSSGTTMDAYYRYRVTRSKSFNP